MFNDERINTIMAKLKRNILLLSLSLSFILLLIKILFNVIATFGIKSVIMEIIIIILVLIIFLIRITINKDVKDELYFNKIYNFYNKAFNYFIYITFTSFAVLIK